MPMRSNLMKRMCWDLLYDIRKFYNHDLIVHDSGSEKGDAHTSCSKRRSICRAFVFGLCPKWSKKYKLSCAEACAKFCLKSAYRNACTMNCPHRCEMNRSGMK
jgi:hypothetical protein